MLILPLLLLPAQAVETDLAWVAIQADQPFCIEAQGGQAPCVRLTGGGTHGAVAAVLIAEHGSTVAVGLSRPPRDACVGAAPSILPDLGLTARVDTESILPVVTAATTLDLGGGATLELRPGLPLWPAEDHDIVVVHLAGLQVVVSVDGSYPVENGRSATAASAGWPTLPAMKVAMSALPAVDGADMRLLQRDPLDPDPKLTASWDETNKTVVLQDSCARIVLPVAGGTPPGRPSREAMGTLPRRIDATLPADTVVALATGHPVGKTTSSVTIGPFQSIPGNVVVPPAPLLTNARGGRTCFSVPTATDRTLPATQRSLELCTATRVMR